MLMLEHLVLLKGFIGEEKMGQRHDHHLKPNEGPSFFHSPVILLEQLFNSNL
jgi:hypothetical protein